MRINVSFDLPDDQRDYEIFHQSSSMQSFLWDFSQQLRSWRKYNHSFKDANDALSQITDEFHTLLERHNVSIDL